MWDFHPSMSLRTFKSMQAVRFFFLYAITSSDQICLSSSEHIRKYRRRGTVTLQIFRPLKKKSPEISVGLKWKALFRFVDRNIRDHLLIGRSVRTEYYRYILRNQLNFPLFFSRFQLYRGLGKGIERGKSHSTLG